MLNVNIDTKLHFIGIGGIGMSGIAEVLLSLGYKVSGSDIAESANVQRLRELGAEIIIGHRSENVLGATVVVYSSAVNFENPEMAEAKKSNLPIMRRAEMLAELMRLKYGLAVAGTHGKTTTTSFLATILQNSDFDPTYIIGGIVKNLDGHAKVGKGDFLVAEADESDGSFLLLSPIMSIVTNIDLDHMDHYGCEKVLLDSFEEFINKVPFYGVSALNAHDKRLMNMIKNIKKPFTTFAIGDEFDGGADYEARDLKIEGNTSFFNLFYRGEECLAIQIKLPGKHNVLNALGAIAIAHKMGVSFEQIAAAIMKFESVGRRFQVLYKNDDIEVVDDYGHHPTEILVTLETLKHTRKSKIIAIFEPHRFSRTRDCWNEFLHCFNSADEVFLSPIYPASEEPIPGIDSKKLVEDINRLHPSLAKYVNSLDCIDEIISKNPGATIITLGAGSIGRKIREWVLDYEHR